MTRARWLLMCTLATGGAGLLAASAVSGCDDGSFDGPVLPAATPSPAPGNGTPGGPPAGADGGTLPPVDGGAPGGDGGAPGDAGLPPGDAGPTRDAAPFDGRQPGVDAL
ncbi:MAG TPA: hypothetical protein VFP84_20700 [Kofleriaceae bacterium]|nr:hypothetical protein [Kofleriaceae bacterium]